MSGRNPEVLDYTVRPSAEGETILAERALDRIQVIDGVDHLDGYALPPDNDEIWNPRTYIAVSERCVQVGKGDKASDYVFWEQRRKVESKLSNSWIRAANIRSIALGIGPLFIRWDEVSLDQPIEEKPTIRKPSIDPLRPVVSDEAAARINARFKRPKPPRGFIRPRDPMRRRRLR